MEAQPDGVEDEIGRLGHSAVSSSSETIQIPKMTRSDSDSSTTSSYVSSSDFNDLLEDWEARQSRAAAAATATTANHSAGAAGSHSAGDSGSGAGASGSGYNGTGGSVLPAGSLEVPRRFIPPSRLVGQASSQGATSAREQAQPHLHPLSQQQPQPQQQTQLQTQPQTQPRLRQSQSAGSVSGALAVGFAGGASTAGRAARRTKSDGSGAAGIAGSTSSNSLAWGRGACGGNGGGGGGGGGAGGAAQQRQRQPRRSVFIAGSVNTSLRSLSGAASLPTRDILLPRLPAPALALIVPALSPATRAALRGTCRTLRALVDLHSRSLTLRPDRRVAEVLNKKGAKAFSIFPALQHATVVLSGSCSGAEGPSSAIAIATATAAPQAGAVQPGRIPGVLAIGSGGAAPGRRPSSAAAAAAAAAAGPPAPLLTLTGWLAVCGVAGCLTSLTLHVGDVTLLEELVLSKTHPHLQRLDLFIGRCGNPHATPPVVQFVVGRLVGLRHLRLSWAGGPGGAGPGTGTGAGGGAGAASLAAAAHGPRRLFLDGRPRLGALLLAGLVDLMHLESLEMQGFLIDTEGHAVLARHWPVLAGRLERLVLSRLHLMVPTSTPPGEQLGELVGGCWRLRELHADLCLPAAAGMPGVAAGGPGGAAAAALLISLMYASRDVRAVRPELLPASLTRLALPGVCLNAPDELAPLSRLHGLTSLEVTAIGAGAAEHLPALQELRLIDCCWRQLLDMLPWRLPPGASAAATAAAGSVTAAARGAAAPAAHEPAAAMAPAAAAMPPAGAPVGPWVESAAGQGPVAAAAPGGAGRGEGDGGSGPARVSTASGLSSRGRSGGGNSGARACGQLRLLKVLICERLDDWHQPDRSLLARVAKGLLPLVDGDCRVKLKVSPDAQPHIWNESDEDGKPWEPVAVWRHIKAAQNLRRLQAETKAVAERLARGRMLQAARRKDKERQFVDR